MADFFRHRLRDTIFGSQDGLVSTLAGFVIGRIVCVMVL